jgi:large subunit ribosomal protein L17
MRHRVAGWKLGRNTSHRRALLRNLVTSLIIEERIETTVTKAKFMKAHVEKMITLGKKGGVANRRLAASFLMTPEAVDKLFNTVGPRFGDRNGGYTRIILTGFRKGDGGAKAFIEILGRQRREPMNKNRIGGLQWRASGRMTAKPISIKLTGGKSGGCASKAVELTSGDLRHVTERD